MLATHAGSTIDRKTWRALAVLMVLALLAPAAMRAGTKGVIWQLADRGSSLAPSGGAASGASAAAKIDPGIDLQAAGTMSVIVQASAGHLAEATAAVTAAGGLIKAPLPIVNGFEATIAARSLTDVARSGAVWAITVNRTAKFDAITYDASTTASNYPKTSGATAAWAQNNMGEGVGVAVIDTGVSSMNDLSPRVVYGPDLSGEGSTVDSFGHGTVMAGIIAGSGADSRTNANGAYVGIAPNAHIVAVKAAGYNGVVDVSTMLQAMHWVAAYQSQFNIRVLNLAWGTASTQSPTLDPLNYAVERLWNQGIVVVVAAGNSGPGSSTITKPGDDPMVITTGAYDDKQNLNASDDSVPPWSSRGPTATGLVKPDLLAPGRTLIATRSFGSNVEVNHPKSLIAPSYIKGSGTSEAAAVTSGVAALLIAAHPSYTPDQVKAVLKGTASPMAGPGPNDQGAGRIQLGAALTANPGPAAWQSSPATGLGSIEASRGGFNVTATCNGASTLIQGEITVRCDAWDGASWTGGSWTGASWTGASWTGGSWTGGSWTGGSWTGGSWTGASWTGASWTGASWTGGSWTGGSWTGGSWTGGSWTGGSWTGASWTGASWTGASWTGGSWTGGSWTTSTYEDEFLTAFWGAHPKHNQHIAGEVSDPAEVESPLHRGRVLFD